MTSAEPRIRAAVKSDALAMAELVNMAGEGLPVYLWSSMTSEGQSVWEVGMERARRESGGFSYRNTTVCECDGRVAASLVGYPLADDPAVSDYSSLPAMFVPLQQLEDMATATWYVNVLATYPEYRGRGLGRRLLSVAEEKARLAGKKGLSVIVADNNIQARRLYESIGCRELARRPMVRNGWQGEGSEWVLLLKSFEPDR